MRKIETYISVSGYLATSAKATWDGVDASGDVGYANYEEIIKTISPPGWARSARVYATLTAVSGVGPEMNSTLWAADPLVARTPAGLWYGYAAGVSTPTLSATGTKVGVLAPDVFSTDNDQVGNTYTVSQNLALGFLTMTLKAACTYTGTVVLVFED